MNFSVCIDAVFRGIETDSALEQVKACGFAFFEFWGWKHRDLEAVRKKADALGLKCGSICTARFCLTDPAGREEFLAGLRESVPAARKTGADFLITQSGDENPPVTVFSFPDSSHIAFGL
jgi:hydroxypyruvate isomerase